MNPHSLFTRKNIYVLAMVVLLVPLYWLGRPSSADSKRGQGSPGGILAQLRNEHGLSQTQLGQIDPASETIRLATFGMRSVACLVLWEKANEYYKRKDWPNFSATVEQNIRLQPNFVSVWRFQSFVFTYNCSVQFDDYRERYRWVMRGIDFLRKGIEYNQHEAILPYDVGWYISQKIGRADESKEYRQLFKADDKFHGARPLPLRDNWLVGKEWYRRAERLVDTDRAAAANMKKSPVLFRSEAPMCQMNYADTLEKEGTFDEVAQNEWKKAADEWQQYGALPMPTSDEAHPRIHLNDQEDYERAARQKAEELDALEPGLRDKILEEKRAALSGAQREALDVPPPERTSKQHELAAEAENKLIITHDEVARRITGRQRREALKLARGANENEQVARLIRHYREIVNFDYWRLRAEVEQTDEAIAAHKWVFKANEALALGELPDAEKYFDLGLRAWRKVLDKFPALKENAVTGRDLMDIVKRYRALLEQLDDPFPKDFILKDIVAKYENEP